MYKFSTLNIILFYMSVKPLVSMSNVQSLFLLFSSEFLSSYSLLSMFAMNSLLLACSMNSSWKWENLTNIQDEFLSIYLSNISVTININSLHDVLSAVKKFFLVNLNLEKLLDFHEVHWIWLRAACILQC